MRNDIGCKFLYDKILIKIYDIIGKYEEYTTIGG